METPDPTQTYTLNCSYGYYSAGTKVVIVARISLSEVVVAPLCESDPEVSFTIYEDCLTKCRNRTRYVPANNRRARRAAKAREREVLQGLMQK